MSENQQANEVGGMVHRLRMDSMAIMAKRRLNRRSTTPVMSLKDATASRLKLLYTAEDLMTFFRCRQ